MHVASEAEVRKRRADVPVTYVIFDLLHLDGESLLDLPYEERARAARGPRPRRGELADAVLPSRRRAAMLEVSKARGLEGDVAKRLASPYRPGRRGRDWLKVKNFRGQEVVIGGWLPGKGRRDGRGRLAARRLLRGEGERRLRFAGKVGTGFSDDELRMLGERLRPLRRQTSPFEGRQPQRDAVFAEPSSSPRSTSPSGRTPGRMRHPSYKGLRDDKPAADVVREEPA